MPSKQQIHGNGRKVARAVGVNQAHGQQDHENNSEDASLILQDEDAEKRISHPLSFESMPNEIQDMIWGEANDSQAAHTFKIIKTDAQRFGDLYTHQPGVRWALEFVQLPWTRSRPTDPSAYRFWNSCLKVKTKNPTFQSHFHRTRLAKLKIIHSVHTASMKGRTRVAFVPQTDLIIIDFDRTGKHRKWHFWQHGRSSANVDRALIHGHLRDMRKVAIHYKSSHENSQHISNPLQCLCSPGRNRDFCRPYKICAAETACFMDCFPDLEEFYLIIDLGKAKRFTTFAKDYKQKLIDQNWVAIHRPVPNTRNLLPQSSSHTIARFFDTKNEYLEHVPLSVLPLKSDGSGIIDSPYLSAEPSLRMLILQIREIFQSDQGNQRFVTPIHRRKQVKVSILIGLDVKPKGPGAARSSKPIAAAKA